MSGAPFPVGAAMFERGLADWRAHHAPVIGEAAADRAVAEYRKFYDACATFAPDLGMTNVPPESFPLIAEAVSKTTFAFMQHMQSTYAEGVVQRHVIGREGTPAGGA